MPGFRPQFKPGDRAIVKDGSKQDGERCTIRSEWTADHVKKSQPDQIAIGYHVEFDRVQPPVWWYAENDLKRLA